MLNWKYPAAAVFAVAAIVPSLCQNTRMPMTGRAHANRQINAPISASLDNPEGQPRPGQGKLMMGKSARALRELNARRKSERTGGAKPD